MMNTIKHYVTRARLANRAAIYARKLARRGDVLAEQNAVRFAATRDASMQAARSYR